MKCRGGIRESRVWGELILSASGKGRFCPWKKDTLGTKDIWFGEELWIRWKLQCDVSPLTLLLKGKFGVLSFPKRSGFS